MYFGNNDTYGADGIAFVLQSVGTSAYGSTGGYFGYRNGNISNAVTVTFHTNVSGSSSDDYMYHTTLKNNYYNQSEYPRVYVGNIEDGKYHDLSISWDVNTKTLKVMFDGIVISTIQKDMVSEIFGVGEVYFGYTAGTGNYWNYQYVKDINVSGTLEGDQSGNVIYEWQYSADSASTWVDITAADSLEFTGINNDTLFLSLIHI